MFQKTILEYVNSFKTTYLKKICKKLYLNLVQYEVILETSQYLTLL